MYNKQVLYVYLTREMKLNLEKSTITPCCIFDIMTLCIYLYRKVFLSFLLFFTFITTMGHKILNRISRILLQPNSCKEPLITQSETVCSSKTSVTSSDSDIASLPCETQQCRKKKRWNTISRKAKQFKRQSQQAQAWFTISYDDDILSKEHFNDEKVEIIVPSESIHSCLSYQSGFHHQPVSFAFSSPVLTPQDTPRTSVDVDSLRIREDERLKSTKSTTKNSIGLAKMVNDILGDAIIIADQESEKEFQQMLSSYNM